jgi:hypothetical protein
MYKLIVTLSLLALSAAATASAATNVSAAPQVGHSAHAAVAKAAPGGFTPLVSKKGGSGVDMAYRIEGTPAVGSPLTVRIQMFSPLDAQASVRAAEGLQLNAPELVMQATPGVRSEHVITVVPQAEGRFYLNVLSTANGRSSATAIAVQVGKAQAQLKPSGKVQVMPSGERVISVPAQ